MDQISELWFLMEKQAKMEELLKKYENGKYNINSRAVLVVVKDGENKDLVATYCKRHYKSEFDTQKFSRAIASAEKDEREQIKYEKTVNLLLENNLPFPVQSGNEIVCLLSFTVFYKSTRLDC